MTNHPTPQDIAVCRFCSSPAVATFRFNLGCVCYPDDRQQALCMQHIIRASPLEDMELIEILPPGLFEAEIVRRFGQPTGGQND